MSASSGKEALDLTAGDSVDVLITDMMMPGMNGLELIERMQASPSGRPSHTILITAYDVPGLKETARRLKVDETIIKPVRPERICQIVSNVVKSVEHEAPPAAGAERAAFKILIADDVVDNVTLLSRYIQNEGFAFITAFDGMETLEKTRAEMPDLILLDINMPRKDGFEVLQEVRADPAIEHIPVIILTAARIGPSDMQSGFNLGADDYVTKPFDRRELMARIRTKLRVKEAEDAIRRRNKVLSVLPEIGQELSARLDINELSDIVLRRLVETLGAMLGHIVIFNPGGVIHRECHLSESAPSGAEAQFPSLNGYLETIRESRQALIINDVTLDPRWQARPNDPTRSVIMVPLLGRFELIGLLILTHEQPGYFNLEHQLLLQAIASQAAIAVENANLYATVSHERQRLAVVLQSAADAILMFEADACLSLINPAAEKLFTDYETKLGLPLARGCGYDELLALLDETLTSGNPKSGEILWPDQRVFAVLSTPLNEAGVLPSCTTYPISRRWKG
jgi:CheY-like chemotaxis protein